MSPDGWMTRHVGEFEFLTATPPPRPYRYLDQIRKDAVSLEIYRFYAFFLAVLAFSLIMGLYIFAAVVGACVFSHYAFLLHMTVTSIRKNVLVRGRLSEFRDHPLTHRKLFAKLRAGKAILDDLTEVDVVFDMSQMTELLQQEKRLEVLIQFSEPKQGQYMRVIAYRTLPNGGMENPAAIGEDVES